MATPEHGKPFTDLERKALDAACGGEPLDPVLDLWRDLTRAGGMPPMSPDHMRAVAAALKRARGALPKRVTI